MTKAPPLARWFEAARRRTPPVASVEAAWARGRLGAYAAYRLRFVLTTQAALVAVAVAEYLLLRRAVTARSLGAPVVAGALGALASAGVWGAHERLRDEVRALVRQRRHADLNACLAEGMWRGLLAVAAIVVAGAASTAAFARFATRPAPWAVAYLAATVFRTALTVATRTIEAPPYALRRVYKPMIWVVAAEGATLLALPALIGRFGPWAVVGRSVVLGTLAGAVHGAYGLRAWRALRLPGPRVGRPRPRPASIWGRSSPPATARAGLAYAAARASTTALWLCLARAIDDASRHAPRGALALAHVGLLLAIWGAGSAEVFYPDRVRLRPPTHAALRARAEAWLERAGLAVGAVGGLGALAAALAVKSALPGEALCCALLVAVAPLGAHLESRLFVAGAYRRLLSVAAAYGLGLACLLGSAAFLRRAPLASHEARHALLVGFLALTGLKLLFLLRGPGRGARRVEGAPVPLASFAAALGAEPGPLSFGALSLPAGGAAGGRGITPLASFAAHHLGDAGLVAQASRSTLVWFARDERGDWSSAAWAQIFAGLPTCPRASGSRLSGAEARERLAALFLGEPGAPEAKTPAGLSEAGLERAFKAAFPGGLVVRVDGPPPPQSLSSIELDGLWPQAVRSALGGKPRRPPGARYAVSSWAPGGAVSLIFLHPLGEGRDAWARWSRSLRDAHLAHEAPRPEPATAPRACAARPAFGLPGER